MPHSNSDRSPQVARPVRHGSTPPFGFTPTPTHGCWAPSSPSTTPGWSCLTPKPFTGGDGFTEQERTPIGDRLPVAGRERAAGDGSPPYHLEQAEERTLNLSMRGDLLALVSKGRAQGALARASDRATVRVTTQRWGEISRTCDPWFSKAASDRCTGKTPTGVRSSVSSGSPRPYRRLGQRSRPAPRPVRRRRHRSGAGPCQ